MNTEECKDVVGVILAHGQARLAVSPSPSNPIPISGRVRLPRKLGYSGHKVEGNIRSRALQFREVVT